MDGGVDEWRPHQSTSKFSGFQELKRKIRFEGCLMMRQMHFTEAVCRTGL